MRLHRVATLLCACIIAAQGVTVPEIHREYGKQIDRIEALTDEVKRTNDYYKKQIHRESVLTYNRKAALKIKKESLALARRWLLVKRAVILAVTVAAQASVSVLKELSYRQMIENFKTSKEEIIETFTF